MSEYVNIILITSGILGVLISLFNLWGAAVCAIGQIRFDPTRARLMRKTVWQMNTLPVLSTILVFTLKHWIFTVVILLALIQMFLFTIVSKKYLKDKTPAPFLMLFQDVYGFLGGIIVVLGTAVILTLSLTGQKSNSPTLLSWYLPVLIVGGFIVVTIIHNAIACIIGLFAEILA